jgi:uncharacterized protein (TIGR00255 family)
MLLSMTGFGEARREQDGWIVAVEIRAVNSRYFKLNFRATEGFAGLEPRIEAVLRESLRRGTVYVQLRLERTAAPDSYRINGEVLRRYRDELASLARQWPDARPPSMDALLTLPGVVEESQLRADSLDAIWNLVEPPVQDAVQALGGMREREGAALQQDLSQLADALTGHLAAVARRAPEVVGEYRERLRERVGKALSDLNVTVEPADLLREVTLFCDRSDVSEEIVRMRSHLEQFRASLDLPESSGRKLEFIAQEMGRETNTIGSKANDSQIAQEVVEMKTALERIREQVQNVE